MPSESSALTFKPYNNLFPFYVVIFADFECVMKKSIPHTKHTPHNNNQSFKTLDQNYIACGHAYNLICCYEDCYAKYIVYTTTTCDEDVVYLFIDSLV